jgi:hypothetical protein
MTERAGLDTGAILPPGGLVVGPPNALTAHADLDNKKPGGSGSGRASFMRLVDDG